MTTTERLFQAAATLTEAIDAGHMRLGDKRYYDAIDDLSEDYDVSADKLDEIVRDYRGTGKQPTN